MAKSCADVREGNISSPVGNWNFEVCDSGLHTFKLAKEVDNQNFLRMGSHEVVLLDTNDDHKQVRQLLKWVKFYFTEGKENQSRSNHVSKSLPPVCPSVFSCGIESSFK